MRAPRAERLRIGGIEMAYEVHGAGDRAFVLVHGFTGSRDDWREMLPRLGARGRTIAPDLRGHGDSSNPGTASGYTFERLTEDLLALLDALEVSRCDLLGHSMGGMLALRAVLAQPERVASLVLMDTAAEPISRAARPFFEASAKLARESGMEALFEAGRKAAPHTPRPPAVVRCVERMGEDAYWARLRAKLVAMDPVAFATLGLGLVEDRGVLERLGEIRCPTTVVVGAQDAPFRRPAEVLAERVSGSRLVVIEDAAHSPQLENPDAWLEAISAHLDRARGEGGERPDRASTGPSTEVPSGAVHRRSARDSTGGTAS